MTKCSFGLHKYGKWEDVGRRKVMWGGLPAGEELVQVKTCLLCNKKKFRAAAI